MLMIHGFKGLRCVYKKNTRVLYVYFKVWTLINSLKNKKNPNNTQGETTFFLCFKHQSKHNTPLGFGLNEFGFFTKVHRL